MSESKKLTKNEKELKSIKNRLSGNDLYWFESLSYNKQYDILFMWKKEKYLSIDRIKLIRKVVFGKTITIKVYPVKFKHFLLTIKNMKKFKVSKHRLRNKILEDLIK
jgi:hypothetical protein